LEGRRSFREAPANDRYLRQADLGEVRLFDSFWSTSDIKISSAFRQQVKKLGVPVLRHQPFNVVSPAPAARLANAWQGRLADV
jgi:hypothetical protein